MASKIQGSFRLFQLWGINVYLHWSWFLWAYWRLSTAQRSYSSPVWTVLEFLALPVIVTIHEFGHSLACRSVGGQADRIVLWPLGGIAFVAPPQRPGAQLWSIAAGPLVNVILFPILLGAVLFTGGFMDLMAASGGHDARMCLTMVFWMNTILLAFNLLPIYPLDGGQILRSLLWFVVGPIRSLLITTIIGFIGVALLIGVAFWQQSIFMGVMCMFILANCWGGLTHARRLAKMEAAPRREGCFCPSCKEAPPCGDFWRCGKCRTNFDTFETWATCPKCGMQYSQTACTACGALSPVESWMSQLPPPLPPGTTTTS